MQGVISELPEIFYWLFVVVSHNSQEIKTQTFTGGYWQVMRKGRGFSKIEILNVYVCVYTYICRQSKLKYKEIVVKFRDVTVHTE